MIECYPSHQAWDVMANPRVCHDIPRLVGGVLHALLSAKIIKDHIIILLDCKHKYY